MRVSPKVQLEWTLEQRPWKLHPWHWGESSPWSALHWYLPNFSIPDLAGYKKLSLSQFLEMAFPPTHLPLWLCSGITRVFLLLGWETYPSCLLGISAFPRSIPIFPGVGSSGSCRQPEDQHLYIMRTSFGKRQLHKELSWMHEWSVENQTRGRAYGERCVSVCAERKCYLQIAH